MDLGGVYNAQSISFTIKSFSSWSSTVIKSFCIMIVLSETVSSLSSYGCMKRTVHTLENAFTGWYDTAVMLPLIISVIVPDCPFMAFLKLCRSPNDSLTVLLGPNNND